MKVENTKTKPQVNLKNKFKAAIKDSKTREQKMARQGCCV